MSNKEIRPPRWMDRFLKWYCKPELLEDLQGDLHEYFYRNYEKNAAKARWIYFLDVLKFFRLYTIQSPKFFSHMTFFTMSGNYFKTSMRSLSRNKLFAGINIIGLAIGMTVGIFIITMIFELQSFDQFHTKKNRIYRVISHISMEEDPAPFATTSILAGTRISTEIPTVEEFVFLNGEFQKDVRVGDNVIQVSGDFASEGFFSLFSFNLLKGDPKTALKEPFSLVLTESIAKKLFGEQEAMGQMVQVNADEVYQVTGVMQDVPSLAHRKFECLASFTTYLNYEVKKKGNSNWFMNWSSMWGDYIYIETSSPELVQNNLDRIAAEENERSNRDITLSLQPLTRIMHQDLYNQPPVMDKGTVWLMLFLSIFVILSACFNYTNLSTARALRRSKEVGIRKIIGASQSQVFMQFLIEAILISFLALLVSIGIFLMIKDRFTSFIESFSGVELTLPLVQTGFYLFIMAVIVGLVSGVLPALLFSKMKAFSIIKNKTDSFQGISFKKILIIFQYTISIAFIVGATLIYKQYLFSKNFDLRYSTDNILNIELQGNDPDALKAEVMRISEVVDISSSGLINSIGSTWGMEVITTNPIDSFQTFYNPVDKGYLDVYRHRLIAGTNFRQQSIDAEQVQIIVNEQFLKRIDLDLPEEAIGRVFNSDISGDKMVIVGVVEDFHYDSVHDKIRPFAFINKNPDGYLNVRVSSEDLFRTVDKIEEQWAAVDKIHPFKASFHEESLQRVYEKYSAISEAIGFLAFISISISTLGLLGMVMFTTETRLKEISIRKVLGAGELELTRLIGKRFLGLLVIATVIGVPLAWHLTRNYFLNEFAYRASVGLLELFGGVFLIFILAMISVVSQTLTAARTNPTEILRNE